MAIFESEVKTITSNEELVYGTLSDLRNLEQSKHLVPDNTIQNIEFYEDKCHFTVNPIGKIDLSIIDKQPYKLIKLGADNAPIDFHVNIHLNKTANNHTDLHVAGLFCAGSGSSFGSSPSSSYFIAISDSSSSSGDTSGSGSSGRHPDFRKTKASIEPAIAPDRCPSHEMDSLGKKGSISHTMVGQSHKTANQSIEGALYGQRHRAGRAQQTGRSERQ